MEENDKKRCSQIKEALGMHLYYEEKYWGMLMRVENNDNKFESTIDKLHEKSEFWKDRYITLINA